MFCKGRAAETASPPLRREPAPAPAPARLASATFLLLATENALRPQIQRRDHQREAKNVPDAGVEVAGHQPLEGTIHQPADEDTTRRRQAGDDGDGESLETEHRSEL